MCVCVSDLTNVGCIWDLHFAILLSYSTKISEIGKKVKQKNTYRNKDEYTNIYTAHAWEYRQAKNVSKARKDI